MLSPRFRSFGMVRPLIANHCADHRNRRGVPSSRTLSSRSPRQPVCTIGCCDRCQANGECAIGMATVVGSPMARNHRATPRQSSLRRGTSSPRATAFWMARQSVRWIGCGAVPQNGACAIGMVTIIPLPMIPIYRAMPGPRSPHTRT